MTEFFLGVDGGGSKTLAIVVDSSMKRLGEGLAGPSNHLRVGLDAARKELELAILAAVKTAGISSLDLTYSYLGIAGADHPKHRKSISGALSTLLPYKNFTIDSDARIALTAGVGLEAGIVVIAGTGSVAFGRNAAGVEARAGGWGPTLGDEGSGYSIGRKGLNAVVRAFDGRGPKTAITELICERYDMCDPLELPFYVYAPTTHADDIATNCRIVIEAARAGDEVAREILEEEGRELGTTVLAVAHELQMEDGTSVAHVGGAFNAGELLLGPMRARIAEKIRNANLHPPLETPADGAARMAIRAAATARDSRRPFARDEGTTSA